MAVVHTAAIPEDSIVPISWWLRHLMGREGERREVSGGGEDRGGEGQLVSVESACIRILSPLSQATRIPTSKMTSIGLTM